MRTAGEGRDVITELPLDPVSYKNSYKTPRHTDRQAWTGFLLSHEESSLATPLHPPSLFLSSPLYSYGWATPKSLLMGHGSALDWQLRNDWLTLVFDPDVTF